ncbi:MAG: BadF/BadG/BcrA/BcrD ATPase family protein [Acutalibacteraceae bacterium]
MKYYIGVDGGGTKTAFALFDENKNVVAQNETEGSNHENLEGAIPQAAGIIANGIKGLLEKAGLKFEDIDGILMGLAGIDHPYQHDEMQEELKKLGITGCRIYNDGFIVIKAGVGAGAGIGYNCGTGTCCNCIDSDGNMLQVGGFDVLSADKGNGHWVGAQTFKIMYDELCLGKNKSQITALMGEKAGIKDRDTLLNSIAVLEDEEKGEEFLRKLIVSFFEAANNEDEEALKVIEEMAQRGADFICSHVKNMNFKDDIINIVLSGSIHTKLPSYKYTDRMAELVAQRTGRKFNFIKLDCAPVTGCVNWLLEN